ncbi:hypothetical protein JNUCC1_01600 [Lentibacillus sp. JNUCC-1]|uniref:DUF3231 family protein n=1 Tax=Lentibacillus sp. JNUCC-1 TaxID=2654513 RepID=UPI0012E74AD2|nr:DUF3231 family protein [Lentibacillus sp. JNUCC-1]MUV37794.1 hypothetical protein [Lentibacillus sp. JNUCC-1]
MEGKRINLTSGEIGSLWTAYMNESMTKQVMAFVLQHIEDTDIKPVVQASYQMSINQVERLLGIFEKEDFAVPDGFTEQDVNMQAPWLFSDVFCLIYVNHMTKVGMVFYSGIVAMIDREDIRNHFTQALTEASSLYNQSKDVMLSKGVNSRPPSIEVPKKSDYIDQKDYFSGLKPFSNKRPLNAIEISYLYGNVLTNELGSKLSMAFAQTSPSKEVQEFMIRAKEISEKHIQIFTDTLMQEDIFTPQAPDVSVSESTTQTFSDKMMMFHINLLEAAGIGNYTTAGAASQRSDLMVNYERLSLEVARLAKSGADIMIKNNWLEKPPTPKDREKLIKQKHDE